MKKGITLLFLISLLSCENEKNPKTYIEVYSLSPSIQFPMSILGCDFVRSDVMRNEDKKHLKITDKTFIDKFLVLYSKYKYVENTDIKNIRYQVIIHQSKKVDTICLGGYFDTFINGRKVNDSPEIFKMLEETVWPEQAAANTR